MDGTLNFSADSRTTAGVLLLTVVAIESGGWFMLRVLRGSVPATGFQKAFFRAGHAHAGVLVILALICQLLAGATRLTGVWGTLAHDGVAVAAILMPAGFFLSVIGRDVARPNPLVGLIYLGAVSLAAGVVSLGVGLLIA
jgi:hypothetical protein